jgi:hypothetical protein
MTHATRAAAALLLLLLAACDRGPRPGTYDQVFAAGNPLASSGYRSTLVIESGNRFRYQMPMLSVSGEIRRSGDSLYFETGSSDVRMVALKGRAVHDTLVLEQPHMSALKGMIGPDVATQRFVRRR